MCTRVRREREKRVAHAVRTSTTLYSFPLRSLRKGMTRVAFQGLRLPFRAEEGAPCHFFHPAAPLSARACRRALACAQAPPPWHALPLRRIRLRMHNSTALPYPDPRDLQLIAQLPQLC